MPEDPLWFGCGTLLPGQGPGNYDDFDGGGTIDGGDGDDPDPPIPGGDFDQGGPPTDIDDDGGGGGGEPGDPRPGNPNDPIEPPGPGTGGGGGGQVAPPKVGPPGPPTRTPTPPAPGGVGGGSGPTCKCTVTSHSFGPTLILRGFCTIQVILFKTCVPLGVPESNHREEVAAYLDDGWSVGGSTAQGPVGCVCGSNDCTNTTLTLRKACPNGIDDTSLGGGGGGAFSAPGKEGQGGYTNLDANSLITRALTSEKINLNDPIIISTLLKERPSGLEDPEIAFNTTPKAPILVTNLVYSELFKKRIDSNVAYILSNRARPGDWDSTKAAGVTPRTIYNSLKPEAKAILREIRNYDGTPISRNQIFSMIGTRVLDGTISEVTLGYLQNLAKGSQRQLPIITRSNNNKVNELVAMALINRNKFTLDPNQAYGRMKNILPNWKTLSSDIDKYIEVSVGGEIRKYYIKDDDTFVDRSTLGISDGDYFDVKVGDNTGRLYTKSEKDHAFILPEITRQKAISLLGGTPVRTLQVNASTLSGIEFDYSLSAPRQDFYVLSCVLSSIDTKPSLTGSFLLKDTTSQYALMDTSTAQGIRDTNEYIKYKANHRVFTLDDEDLMLDYMVATSSITLKQTDILFDSPKNNKTIPLLTRQVPWYIMVYPTNRSDLNIFNSKSKIESLAASGDVVRSLNFRPTLVPNFNKRQNNIFVKTGLEGVNAVDVYGNTNLQARTTKITSTDKVFTTGYSIKTGLLNKQSQNFVAAKEYTPSRKKTGFRLVKEIITELNNNYLLGLNGIGKSLTEFDVYSRLTLQQFSLLSRLERFRVIGDSLKTGLVADVKIIPPIDRADSRISLRHTQLVRRRVGAPADTFAPIKGTKSLESLVPPTTAGESTTGPVRR